MQTLREPCNNYYFLKICFILCHVWASMCVCEAIAVASPGGCMWVHVHPLFDAYLVHNR